MSELAGPNDVRCSQIGDVVGVWRATDVPIDCRSEPERQCVECRIKGSRTADVEAAGVGGRHLPELLDERAPYAKIRIYMKRMGWSFNWVSSGDSDFNFDYGVSFPPKDIEESNDVYYNYRSQPNFSSEREGLSVFYKDLDDAIFHTHSTYARGIDMVNGAYQYLDLVPKGRDEVEVGKLGWVQHHDEY